LGPLLMQVCLLVVVVVVALLPVVLSVTALLVAAAVGQDICHQKTLPPDFFKQQSKNEAVI
jgi:hypothetical protein